MDKIEKMFLDLNSVLVKFWIEQGRPDKETKIALLERMLDWYKKMGYVTPQTLSEEPDNDASLESSASYDTQKYAPRPSVDIEDVARVQFASHVKVFDKKRKAVFDWEQFKEVVGIFYSFGKKDSETKEKEQPDKSLEEAAEEWCKINNKGIALCADKKSHYLAEGVDAFKAGAKWMAKQEE